MEFMQFHPTVLYIAGSSRHLLTEALRGEGAYLRDRNGHRFMPDFDPQAELAPRDDVSRAIVDRHGADPASLRLSRSVPSRRREDPRPLPRHRAPCCAGSTSIWRAIRSPFDPERTTSSAARPSTRSGRTSVPGLWAAGELTSSGLHGANRLASNSLLEGLVYGARAAEDMVRHLDAKGPVTLEVPRIESPIPRDLNRRPLDLKDIQNALRSLMWRRVGITRDAEGLAEAAHQVDYWCGYVLPHLFDEPDGLGASEYADRRPSDDRRRGRANRVEGRPHAFRSSRHRTRLGATHRFSGGGHRGASSRPFRTRCR